jgi:hypothetical protein
MGIGAKDLQTNLVFAGPVEEPGRIAHRQMDAAVRFQVRVSGVEGAAGTAREKQRIGHCCRFAMAILVARAVVHPLPEDGVD